MSKVRIAEAGTNLVDDIALVFEPFGGGRGILGGRDEVLVKVNGVELKPHCYTPPDFIEALVRYLRREGARRIYVADNCTQGNFTRLVFHATGITRAARRAGAEVLFLDEGPVERLVLPLPRDAAAGAAGYDQQEIGLPRVVMEKLLRNRSSVAYINVPKFKTHSMTSVTLGIKNQWGFVAQRDRIADHNYLLSSKLVDILACLRPDFTLIDAREATQHGHYPSERLLDKILVPYGLIIGGDDVVSVDAVGCHLMGFPWRDIEHLRLAHERGLGTADLDRIEIIGDPAKHRRELSSELLPIFPEDVDVHKGEELCCREGCKTNVMAALQVLSLDHQGKGGFSVLMGKGWDTGRLENLQDRVLVVGKCAVEEVGERLRAVRDPDSVALSNGCNDLTETVTCLLKWMKVSPHRLVPVNPLRTSLLLLQARAKGSTAAIPPLWVR